jgi:hypothetical protein
MHEGVSVGHGGETGASRGFEVLCAISIAFFAAILAITDLGSGRYGDDEIMGTNEKANTYAWYQSKSIKESLLEGQRDLLETLLESGSIAPDRVAALRSMEAKLEAQIGRYTKEKRELMLGSEAVGKENWIQDIDGELGKVAGAKVWEKKLGLLGRAGDLFDLSVLFLQLCLVMGAISLVMQGRRVKWSFYGLMVFLGLLGIIYSARAFLIALSA